MILPIIFTVAGVVLLAVFLKFRVGEKRVIAVIIKAPVSFCFIASALSSLARLGGKNAGFAMLIVCGLVFGLLGDIWLDLKYICLKDEDTFTLAGFLVFAIGHCFFIAALAGRFCSSFKAYCVLIPIGCAVISWLITYFGEKSMHVEYGKYKLVVPSYGALLISFATFTFSLILLTKGTEAVPIVIFIASQFFFVSDMILNKTYFGKNKTGPVYIITNHVTYYIAQFMIAFSLCLLK